MNGDQKNLYNNDSSHIPIGGEHYPLYATPNFPLQLPTLNHSPILINPISKPIQQDKVGIPVNSSEYNVPSNDMIRTNGSAPIATGNPTIPNSIYNPFYQEIIQPVMCVDPQTNILRTVYIPQIVLLSNTAQQSHPTQQSQNVTSNSEENSNNFNYYYPQFSNNHYNFNDQMHSFNGGAPNSANIQPTGDIYTNYNTDYNPKSEMTQSHNHHQSQHIQNDDQNDEQNDYQNEHENGEPDEDENDDEDDDEDEDEDEDEDQNEIDGLIDQNDSQSPRNVDDCDSDGNSSDEDQISTVHGEEMLQDMQNISFFRDIVKVPSKNNSSTTIENSLILNKDITNNVAVSVGSIVSESSTGSSSRFKKTRIKELTTNWNYEDIFTIDNLVTMVPDDVLGLEKLDLKNLVNLLTETQTDDEQNISKDVIDSDSTDNVSLTTIDSLATTADTSVPSSISSKSTSTSSTQHTDQYNTKLHKSHVCCEHTIISPSISDDSPTIQHIFLPYTSINSTTPFTTIPQSTCNSLLLPDKCLSSSSSNVTVTTSTTTTSNSNNTTTTTNTTPISNNIFNGSGISSNANCSPGSNNTKIFPTSCHRASIPFAHRLFFASPNNPTMLSAVMSPSIASTSVACNSLFTHNSTTTTTTSSLPTVSNATVTSSRHQTSSQQPPRPISHDSNLTNFHFRNNTSSTSSTHKPSYICYPTPYLSHHHNYHGPFNHLYNNYQHRVHNNSQLHNHHHHHHNHPHNLYNNQLHFNNSHHKMSTINSTSSNSNSNSHYISGNKMKSRRRRWSISHYRSSNNSNTSSISDLVLLPANSSFSIANQNCCSFQHAPNTSTNHNSICKNNGFNGGPIDSVNGVTNGDVFSCPNENENNCSSRDATPTITTATTTTASNSRPTSSITVITNGYETNGNQGDQHHAANGGNEPSDCYSPCTTPSFHNTYDPFTNHSAVEFLSPSQNNVNFSDVRDFDRHIEDEIDKFKKSLQYQISHYFHDQEMEIKRITERNSDLERRLFIESDRADSLEKAIRDNLPSSDWVKYDLKKE